MTGLHALGGYCASSTCVACDGACVGIANGELCMQRCVRDDECRVREGYVCDAAWHACVMPNSTAIVPRTCPAPRIARDPQFESSRIGSDAHEIAATTTVEGELIVAHASGGAIGVSQRMASDVRLTTALGSGGTHPSIVRAGATLFATWSNDGVWFASSPNGQNWLEAQKLDDAGERPSIAAGGGVIYVLFAHEGLRVRASRDGGKTWEPAKTVMPAGDGSAVVAGGTLHVVGIEGGPLGAYGSANQRVLYNKTVVSQRDEVLPFYFATPSIAVDARRKWIYIAYVRGGRDARWDIVLAASKDNGATWTRTRIGDDPACAIHMMPALALDDTTGVLHIAWYDGRGTAGFAHATCAIGLASCTQLGRINTEPFATALATSRDTATWIGGGALVIDNQRRILHAAWVQPFDGKTYVFTTKAKLRVR